MARNFTPLVVQARVSLWELACLEADIFKWLESERSGYDVGLVAHQEWIRLYWRIFCRYRLIDHLTGKYWIDEFDQASFGCLSDQELLRDPVMIFVITRFADEGWENLDFLLQAPQHGFEVPEVRDVLSLVDVNAARVDPPNS